MNDLVWRLCFIFLLIAINAFFVTAEFSIVTVRRSRINQLVEEGDRPARSVKLLQGKLDQLLTSTQLGISFVTLALGWLSEKIVADLTHYLLVQFAINSSDRSFLTHAIAIPVAFSLVVYCQIVLGELFPKYLAFVHAEELSRNLAPIIQAIAHIFRFFVWILDQSTKTLLKLSGVQIDRTSWYRRVTPEELQLIIATELESSGLDNSERTILNNILEFGDISASEIMIPRHQMAVISENATFGELLQEVAVTRHFRYPVTGESLDDILGIIDFKDLAVPLSERELTNYSLIKPWIKPVRFVPDAIPLSDLLTLMQRSCLKTAMVVDEYGRTSGLITLEDLVEEILGKSAPDENEDHENGVILQRLDDETVLVEAQMNLAELNEILGLNLPLLENYQTLGGFLLYQWQKIPLPNETLSYQNLTFTVITAQGPRLEKIRVHRQLEVKSAATSQKSELKLNPIILNRYSPSR